MPCHTHVVYLVVQYLQAKGLYASSLALQQESGVDVNWLRGRSREMALLRRWIFAGDGKKARALLMPLATLEAVSEDFTTALMALDELEVRLTTLSRDDTQSRLAQAKLECFKKIVPLFRGPVGPDESDVLKYVVMPKDQLLAFIEDAVHFHRQEGDKSAQSCISVACSGKGTVARDEEQEASDLLLLDEFQNGALKEENQVVSIEARGGFDEGSRVSHSVEWTPLRRKQRNRMALSTSLSNYELQGVHDKVMEAERCSQLDVKETTDVAVSCELDVKATSDAAVNCGFDLIQMVDVGVDCRSEEGETADIGVNCEPIQLINVAIQTEKVQQLMITDEKKGLKRNEATTENQMQRDNNIVAEAQRDKDEPAYQNKEKNETQGLQWDSDPKLVQSSIPSSKSVATSWTRNSWCNPAIKPSLERTQFEQNGNSCPLENENWTKLHQTFNSDTNNNVEIANASNCPQHYDELTLDHVVCAAVIAQVKEPQAVRALDVHPTGAQLAIGTNARALRVFTMSSPLQHQQFSWSSSRDMILPILPVSLERHKYHDSGIYCLSYNHHLIGPLSGTSMVASGAADGSVKVLVLKNTDSVHNQPLHEIWVQRGDNHGLMGKTRALQFASPHLLWTTATTDRRLCCWDIRKNHSSLHSGPFQTLDGHVGEIQAIAMPNPFTSAANSTLLLSAALDNTVRLWDIRSRRCERLVTSALPAAFSLHFHPINDNLVVSGHQDGSVALWDLRSTAREALQRVVLHQDECRSVRWSPGGQWLLSAAFDGTLCVMQASRSMVQPVASYHKHCGKVLQAQWHPKEPAFVSSGADKQVKVWAFG